MGQSPDSKYYNNNKVGKYLIQGNADIKNRKTCPRIWTSQCTKTCQVDDVIMTVRAPVGYIAKSLHSACIGRGVSTIRNKKNNDIKYLFQFLLSFEKKWIKFEQGSTFTAVNTRDVKNLKLSIPTLPEQQKIADFLGSVDEWLGNLREQKEKLESYKKGLMQKIFSQEIRFKADNGKDFPEWEEKRLGEVLDYEQPTKYIVNNTEYDDDHKTPVLTAGKSFILGYTNEVENIFNASNQPVIIFDDFTTAKQFVDFPFKVKSSAMKILKNKDNKIADNRFVYGVMQRTRFALGEEHKRFWISEYSKIKIGLPSLAEQQKIADFLTSIDNLINLKQQQIAQAEGWKKGLMQGLFM